MKIKRHLDILLQKLQNATNQNLEGVTKAVFTEKL